MASRSFSGKATPDVGYVFQRDTLFPWRSVADNIGFGLQLAGVPDAERRETRRRLRRAGRLAGIRTSLSLGAFRAAWRQRAALMRTLVVETAKSC